MPPPPPTPPTPPSWPTTTPTFPSLHHHVLYGNPNSSTPETERALPSHWETTHFSRTRSASWGLHIPKTQRARIMTGCIPRDMDDKWFIYTTDAESTSSITTSEEGAVAKMHLFRSWTGFKCFELHVVIPPVDADGEEDLVVERIIWEIDGDRMLEQEEREAKETVVWILRGVLEVEIYEQEMKVGDVGRP